MLTLPVPATLAAGVQSLQVAHRIPMGTPPVSHRGFESNAAPFVLHPAITNPGAATESSTPLIKITNITAQVTPNVVPGQRVVAVLNAPGANPPQAYASAPVVVSANSNQVVIPIENVPPGSYFVRVQIDGAESLLTMAGGVFNGPAVNVP